MITHCCTLKQGARGPCGSHVSPTRSADEVTRRLEFRKEMLTRTQVTKLGLTTGLPEIDLVDSRLLGQEGEPVIICDANETLHLGPRLSSI